MNAHASNPNKQPGSSPHAGQSHESIQVLIGAVENWALTQSRQWFTKFATLLTQYLGEVGQAVGQKVDLDTMSRVIQKQEDHFNAAISRLIQESFALHESTREMPVADMPGMTQATRHPPDEMPVANMPGLTQATRHPPKEIPAADIPGLAQATRHRPKEMPAADMPGPAQATRSAPSSSPRAVRSSATFPSLLDSQKNIQRRNTQADALFLDPGEETAAEPGPVRRSNRTHWNLPPEPKKGSVDRGMSIPLPDSPVEVNGLRLRGKGPKPDLKASLPTMTPPMQAEPGADLGRPTIPSMPRPARTEPGSNPGKPAIPSMPRPNQINPGFDPRKPAIPSMPRPDQTDPEAGFRKPAISSMPRPDQSDPEAGLRKLAIPSMSRPDQSDPEAGLRKLAIPSMSRPERTDHGSNPRKPAIPSMSRPDQTDPKAGPETMDQDSGEHVEHFNTSGPAPETDPVDMPTPDRSSAETSKDLLIGVLKTVLTRLNSENRVETRALTHLVTSAVETLTATGGDLGDPRTLETLKIMGDTFSRLQASGWESVPEIAGLGSALEKIALFFGPPQGHDLVESLPFPQDEPDPEVKPLRSPPARTRVEMETQPGVAIPPAPVPVFQEGGAFRSVLQDYFSGLGKKPSMRELHQG
ncbi:MAG: hypothetical protein H7833_09895 [Magnetococcus sp. DMHC-1]|nr:hypothetical protein [Magnetococcales bacterium]